MSLLPANGVVANVWSNPLVGRLTSPFGLRVHPIFAFLLPHAGTDVAASCGTPIHAAADGVVVFVGKNFQGRTGNQLVIAHGDGVITRYGHLLSGTTSVKLGDVVRAGQEVAAVGGNPVTDPDGAGNSTGCHLHFEVNFNNGRTPVDPDAFLRELGVRLGQDQPVEPAPFGTGGTDANALIASFDSDALVTEYVDYIAGVIPEFRHEPRSDA
ncbi:MAG TPA: M23 family metallopeptidase [Actinomycetaceae bacterium]|nr:M23 family metallopeptidase [Actinomycetaceae bacterium]